APVVVTCELLVPVALDMRVKRALVPAARLIAPFTARLPDPLLPNPGLTLACVPSVSGPTAPAPARPPKLERVTVCPLVPFRSPGPDVVPRETSPPPPPPSIDTAPTSFVA